MSDLETIAERLRLSRKALGHTISSISELIGSQPSAWTNYECGIRRISLDQAFRLKARTGLTLEWIYCGTITGLPADIAEKIIAIMPKGQS